jgi:hypothetical protein
LPVVFYGYETCSLTLWEEYRFRVYEIRMLRKLFGPKRGEVTGGWRRLHNEEHHNVYSSPSIIRVTKSRRVKGAGHVVSMEETKNAYKILVSKPEGKRSLGRSTHSWEYNIKMDLR